MKEKDLLLRFIKCSHVVLEKIPTSWYKSWILPILAFFFNFLWWRSRYFLKEIIVLQSFEMECIFY